MKKYLLASLAVFVAWAVLDFVVHVKILGPSYAATASLWRPMDQMNMGMMKLVSLIAALAFTGIYASLVRDRSVSTGLKYGVLYGIAVGVPMGFGSYGYLPISMGLAWGWFLGAFVNAVVGGLLAGAILKPKV